MKRAKVTLHGDVSAMEDTATILSMALARGLPDDIADQFVASMDAGASLFTFETERLPAAGTDHFVVVAKPTELLSVFLAAVRTDDFDLGKVRDALRHIHASIPNKADASMDSFHP